MNMWTARTYSKLCYDVQVSNDWLGLWPRDVAHLKVLKRSVYIAERKAISRNITNSR